MNITNWNYYYNLEGQEQVRANLVYTPYVSPDEKTFCMSFNRDPLYHTDPAENAHWTGDLLQDRFEREVTFHQLAEDKCPTLHLVGVDLNKRQIFLEWLGDDFYMQGLKAGGYDQVIPDWKEQWKLRIEEMWSLGIKKMSLHPNSWIARYGVLVPFNWFFSYYADEDIVIKDVLIQISQERQSKLLPLLEQSGLDINAEYSADLLQKIALNSFRSNYPESLIDSLLK
jgi:hypothetical protein